MPTSPAFYIQTSIQQLWSRVLIRTAALCMTCLVVLHCYVLERPVKSDDGGFLNPVMEYLHTGRVVYPAHGPEHAQTMIVHPPVHYWLVGLLMKNGLSFFPAAATLPLIGWCILALVTLAAPWPDRLKLSFLLGAFIPNFVLIDLDPTRSELQMAITWLAALVCFESARLLDWEKYRLLAGSFLIAYASGLHYFALPALVACGFYVIWMIWDLGWTAGLKRAVFVMAGSGIFLIPYFGLFLIPEYSGILRIITSLKAATGAVEGLHGGISKAFQYHRETYAASYGYIFPSPSEYKSVFFAMLRPILTGGVPAVLISTPVLLFWKQTCGLAIAALPFELPLLLFFNHKSLPYYRGEFSLYYVALFALAFCGLEWVGRRVLLRHLEGWIPAFVSAALAFIVVADSRAWQIPNGAVFVDELALARATGKAVLGDHAIVGGRSVCLWYTSGGRYYRNFVSDLIYPPDVSKIDVHSYFDGFDAVAEEPAGSWLTYNQQKLGAPSWYANGTLQLQGFYAGRNIRGWQYSYYLSGTRKRKPVEAYFWRGAKFFRFVEDSAGSSAVMSLVSPHGGAWTALGTNGLYLIAVALPPDQQNYVTLHVVSRTQAEAFQMHPPKDCVIREVIYGNVSAADARAMAATIDYHGEMPEIFYTTPELLATQVTPSTSQAIPLRNVLTGSVLEQRGNIACNLHYVSPPVQSAALLYSSVVELNGNGPHLVSLLLKIRSGGLVISVVDPDSSSTLIQLFRYHAQPLVSEKALIADPRVRRIQLMVWANNERASKTEFEIDGASVASAEWKKKVN